MAPHAVILRAQLTYIDHLYTYTVYTYVGIPSALKSFIFFLKVEKFLKTTLYLKGIHITF
jgi:hypothetical protein